MNNLTELVIIPAPYLMGHILSIIQFAKLIIQKDDRISIQIIIIPFLPNNIKSYIDSQSLNNPYPTRLRFVMLPTLFNRPDSYFPTFARLYMPAIKQYIEARVRVGCRKPAGFVLDFLCMAMIDVANELHVPSYIYYTSGAYMLSFLLHAQSLAIDHDIDVATMFSDPEFTMVVPGFKNSVTSKVIPSSLQDEELKNNKKFHHGSKKFREVKGILVNTYEELESFAIRALLNGENKNIPPIYPVGPNLELDHERRGRFGDMRKSTMEWLDGQPESSVVFLCFGSLGSFDQEQVQEIAKALDKSKYRFLWTLRKPSLEGSIPSAETFVEALPEGFLESTSNKGKVIGWACQTEILAHPAIGEFISHCGWNSILESVWFGIPIATWPLYAEQQLNAFELVKEINLGVEISVDFKWDISTKQRNFLVTAEKIKIGVENLMSMDNKIRRNVKKMRDKARRALEEGGSSHNWLSRFIVDVINNA